MQNKNAEQALQTHRPHEAFTRPLTYRLGIKGLRKERHKDSGSGAEQIFRNEDANGKTEG